MPAQTHNYKIRVFQAIGLVVIGYLGFSIADLASKILQEKYIVYQVLWISGSIGALITGTWLLARHGWRAFFPQKLGLHLLRALFVFGTAFCMVSAVRTLPLADFYGIAFISPFIILILSSLLLKEAVGWRRWMAVSVAFTGVLILAGPQYHNFSEGILYALGGASCAAIQVICMRKIGHGAPIPLYGFYPTLCIGLLNGLLLWVDGSFLPFGGENAGFFAIHGPAAALGIICTGLGIAKAPETAVVAPFVYTQIIWGIGFGWLFFAAIPGPTTLIGLVFVIGAGVYSIYREYHNAHTRHTAQTKAQEAESRAALKTEAEAEAATLTATPRP